MRYVPKVSTPSAQGTFERILSSKDPGVRVLREQVGGKNFHTFRLLALAWTSLISDSPLGLKPDIVFHRFLQNYLKDPIGTIGLFGDIASTIEESLSMDDEGNDISINLDERIFRTPVYREYAEFRRTRQPALLRYLLTFLNFGKKVAYENPDLDAIAFHKWVEVESRLANLELPDWLPNLKLILEYLLGNMGDFVFLPKHGNGSVAEPKLKGTEAKNAQFSFHSRINHMYNRGKLGEEWDLGPSYVHPVWLTKEKRSRSISRLKFVPKTYKTSRSICMEPIVFQWAQQGVRAWYERGIRQSPLGQFVILHDQTENQMMAQYGSLTGRVDTIDLSSASDSVAWTLVKSIFPARILKHLAATRTSKIEITEDNIVDAHKFAPMGSALCFPVQSTIYAAIVMMVSIAQAYGREWKLPGALDGLDLGAAVEYLYGDAQLRPDRVRGHVPFRCYGDDITCDQRVTSNVMDALSLLGFTVNEEKSFVHYRRDTYRESCGKHFHRGSDVTPLRFKLKRLSPRITVDTFAGVVDFANRALDYGYLNLRKTIVQYALYVDIINVRVRPGTRNPVLFTTYEDVDSSMAIRCVVPPDNRHLVRRDWNLEMKHTPDKPSRRSKYTWNSKKRKWNVNHEMDDGIPSHIAFQRAEVRSITVGPKETVRLSRNYDRYHLTLWWRSRYVDVSDTAAEAGSSVLTDDALGVGAKWRWTPI